MRLQSENKMLCVQEETYRQKLTEVQTELEDAQRSKNTLETQDRYSCACVCVCVFLISKKLDCRQVFHF